MKTKITLALLVTAIAAGLTASGSAVTNSEDGTIEVNVTSTTKIDLSPNTLDYNNVEPGTNVTESVNGYEGIEVENKGSTNVTKIWVETTEPADRPFGTGLASEYDAGNFIQLKTKGQAGSKNAPDAGFHYAGRRSYNESNKLSYVTEPTDEGEIRYGRFRSANETFFWAINQSGSGGTGGNTCTGGSGAWLKIGNDPHSKDSIGSVDFSDTSEFDAYNLSIAGAGNAGRADNVNFKTYESASNEKQYSAFTWCGDSGTPGSSNATFVSFRRYDRQQVFNSGTDYSTASNSLQNLLSATGPDQPQALKPGEHFTVKTRMSIPFGVATGEVGSGTLTLYASN
jgi:hypothetical protein